MRKNIEKRLFCDSHMVFESLANNGVISRDVTVMTRSLVMAIDSKIKTIYFDDEVEPHERITFKAGITSCENILIKKLSTVSDSHAHKIIFLQLFNNFQSEILDAKLLSRHLYFSGETIVAIAKTGNAGIDEVTHPNWLQWLQGIDNVSVIEVPVKYSGERAPRGAVDVSILDKVRLGGWQIFAEKAAKQKWFSELFGRERNLAFTGQTELLRDAVASCISNNKVPFFIDQRDFIEIESKPDFSAAEKILVGVKSELSKRLELIPDSALRVVAWNVLLQRLAVALGRYSNCLSAWESILKRNKNLKCILSGYMKGADAMAMSDACKKKGIKIIAFQHGITRELLSEVRERRVFFETSFCDTYVSMNPAAAGISQQLALESGKKVTSISWPSPFLRISNRKSATKKISLFVSANLYSGHKPNGVPPLSDLDFCKLESALVQRVFGPSGKRIDYKPYPAMRQLDQDPIIEKVNAWKNMSIVGAHQDLRYMLNWYRMFITTKATSTVSWIVATRKPLIFIDHKCHARLSEEARSAFSQGFFLFDQSDPDFELDLKFFLQRPFGEILEEWNSKSASRLQTIERFFGGTQKQNRNQLFDAIKHNL